MPCNTKVGCNVFICQPIIPKSANFKDFCIGEFRVSRPFSKSLPQLHRCICEPGNTFLSVPTRGAKIHTHEDSENQELCSVLEYSLALAAARESSYCNDSPNPCVFQHLGLGYLCLVSDYSVPLADVWKPIGFFQGKYEVSQTGKIRNVKTGCIRKLTLSRQGYINISIYHKGRYYSKRVHRLVANAFLGAIPEGMFVNHKDCNKTNNHVSNLEYVTHSENILHAHIHKRFKVGIHNPRAILKEKDVLEIRHLSGKVARVILARRFGVSYATIEHIQKRMSWKHLS